MCGIVAFVGPELPSPESRREALDRLAHRGPDATGTWEGSGVWLGHQRLSILDPTPGANQPMSLDPDDPRTLRIIYNGEIYNHRELRAPGRAWRTGSDTETILDLFAREDLASFARLDGIFGFVLVDGGGRVVVARDRMGVKPVYVARRDGGVWIASEIKAIPGAVGAAVPDSGRALEFLRYEGISGPKTLFRGIESLTPGAFLEVEADGSETRTRSFDDPLASISAESHARASRWSWEQAKAALAAVVTRGIEAQMLSDVPIGTLCSGGVDSSLVTAIVHRKDPSVRIFAVDFAEKEITEREYIETVARHLGIRVSYSRLDRETFLSDLVECIYHNDHPLSHANSVGIWRVSRLARESGVKVLLTGEGADELFGGYESYRRLALRLVWGRRLGWISDQFRRRLRYVLAKPIDARDGIALRSTEGDLGRLAHGHLARSQTRNAAREAWSFIADPVEREVLAALSSDLFEYLEPILQRQDRMSMMAGVESRVPFLANPTVEFAASLPLGLRIHRGDGKALLKAVAERFLPRSIVRRPKIGFRVPVRSWVRFGSDDLFRGGFVESELGAARGVSGASLPASLAFPLLNLEIWGRIFVRGEDRRELAERLIAASEGIDREAARRALRARETVVT